MSKIHLFIDTNVFLAFFAYTNDDIEELKKLVGLIKNEQIELYLTEQACSEFYRNRETKILQALAEFGKISIPGLPRLMAHYPKAGAFSKSAKIIKKIQNDLIEKAKADALAEDFPADSLFAALINASEPISADNKDLVRARRRTERNDPPGKAGSFGDRLNWELLLEYVPDDTNLYVISKDGDFSSSIDATRPHPVLVKEWETENGGELRLHTELRAFLADHFPDINLATDVGKRSAIDNLKNSMSFAWTHDAISKLSEYRALLTADEIDELVDAAIQNGQISWIGKDSDVREFFSKIIGSRWEKYPEERQVQISTIFGLSPDGEIMDPK